MLAVSMAIFALVIAASAHVVALWNTSLVAARTRVWDSNYLSLRGMIKLNGADALRAELDDLRGALDVIRASNRKEFGALWGRMGGRGADRAKTFDGATGLPLGDDDELEAVLALQAAKPVGPNGA